LFFPNKGRVCSLITFEARTFHLFLNLRVMRGRKVSLNNLDWSNP